MRHKNLEVIFKMKPYRMHNIQSAISSRQISKMKDEKKLIKDQRWKEIDWPL